MKTVKRDTQELRRGVAERAEDIRPNQPIAKTLHPVELRKLRNYVRFTTSLISTQGRVREQMGPNWAANFEERIIYWRPSSGHTGELLTPEEVLFLVTHEAGHLNWTGGWNVPSGWGPKKTMAFKGFLNAVEDIRIERLQAREFPGFAAIRTQVNRKFMAPHFRAIKDYGAPDQVAFRWLAAENGVDMDILPDLKTIADSEWPAVSRMCNLPSTMALAEAVAPIFDRLYDKTAEELRQEAKESSGQAGPPDANGNPTPGGRGPTDPSQYPEEPSDNPSKSPMGTGQDPLTQDEKLQLLREAAKGYGKDVLKEMERIEEQLKQQAQQAAESIGGHEAGDGKDAKLADLTSDWFEARDALRAEIGSLARQFKSVLTTNKADNWLEGQRRGQFNSRRARKAVAGDNRIFRKRQAIGEHDYTIAIAVDASGSMAESTISSSDPKCYHALRATVLLTEAAEKAGLKTIVVPYSGRCKRIKGVGTHLNDAVREELGSDIAQPSGGTNESYSLIAAQDELAKVPMSRRILFVISDGETSDAAGAASLVEEIHQMGVPTVAIAIALGEGALPHHSTVAHVNQAEELLMAIPRLINEQIMRKGHR